MSQKKKQKQMKKVKIKNTKEMTPKFSKRKNFKEKADGHNETGVKTGRVFLESLLKKKR